MNIIKIIYYIVSVASIFLYIMSVQFKKKTSILKVQAGASVCYLSVYAIKGAWSGVCVEFIEAIKNYIFMKIEEKGKKIPIYMLLIFLVLLIIVSLFFYDGPFSLLPLLINCLMFTSTYYKDPKVIRWVTLIAGILWGLYNAYLQAYIICIGNVLEIVSAVIALIRYRNKKTEIQIKIYE